MVNDKIIMFTEDNKAFMSLDLDNKVDHGIRRLVDEINKFEYFVSMNSCQGSLIPEEAEEHCPITYVDFYVLYDQYNLANELFTELASAFGSMLECSMRYEADLDFVDDDEVEENGYVNLRYSIQLNCADIEFYDEVINKVKQLREKEE